MSIFIKQVQKVILENDIQDYFEDNFIDDLVVYVEFLDNIPSRDIDKIATDFVDLVLDYYTSQTQYKNPLPSDVRKLYKREYKENLYLTHYFKGFKIEVPEKVTKLKKSYSPSRAIQEDIKIAEKFRDLLLQISMSSKQENGSRIWFMAGNRLKDVPKVFEFTEKLIDDLENKKFETVLKSTYYDDFIKPSKTEIRNFIKQVVKTYKINTTDLSINQLIENI